LSAAAPTLAPVLAESVDRHLRALDSEELMRLAEDLRELQASDGWRALTGLIDVHREKVRTRMETTVKDEAVFYTHVNGQLVGLRAAEQIMDKVFDVARAVREQLEHA
jgi:hypothetical protein